MNLLRLLGTASSTIVLLSACTSPASSETVGSGGSDSSVSVGSSGSSGSVNASSGWKAAPDQAFGKLALASAGNETALAYVESTADQTADLVASVIRLQRLDPSGARLGAPIELGHLASSPRPRVTLASDGVRYLACWDDASAVQISCALAPVAEGPALPALSVAGLWPSLAYSAGAWTLAYGVSKHVAVARVIKDGSALGAPALFDVDQVLPPKALIAATPGGFALVSAPDYNGGQTTQLHLLDSAFAPLAAPLDLGMQLWFRDAAALSVNGAKIAVSISEPYGSRLFFIEGGAIAGSHAISGGGKMGPEVALTVDGASFGRLAQDDSQGPLTYTTIEGDELHVTPQMPAADPPLSFYNSSFAVLKTDATWLFASTVGSQNDEIIVAGVHRP